MMIELRGGPLDGQEAAVSIPDGESLLIDTDYLPMVIPVFPSRRAAGQKLAEYKPGPMSDDKQFFDFTGYVFPTGPAA